MDRYETLADALEGEVLTEMAGAFFGARKAVEDLIEDFQLSVEELRSRKAKVFARVFFLRFLVLGAEGEAALFAALGPAAAVSRTPAPSPAPAPGGRPARPSPCSPPRATPSWSTWPIPSCTTPAGPT